MPLLRDPQPKQCFKVGSSLFFFFWFLPFLKESSVWVCGLPGEASILKEIKQFLLVLFSK